MTEKSFICTEHSGCIERIKHQELDSEIQWREIKEMKKAIDKIPVRFNAILIVLVTILLGVIANFVK